MRRTGAPRRESSTAAVSPARPAPAINTGVIALTSSVNARSRARERFQAESERYRDAFLTACLRHAQRDSPLPPSVPAGHRLHLPGGQHVPAGGWSGRAVRGACVLGDDIVGLASFLSRTRRSLPIRSECRLP